MSLHIQIFCSSRQKEAQGMKVVGTGVLHRAGLTLYLCLFVPLVPDTAGAQYVCRVNERWPNFLNMGSRNFLKDSTETLTVRQQSTLSLGPFHALSPLVCMSFWSAHKHSLYLFQHPTHLSRSNRISILYKTCLAKCFLSTLKPRKVLHFMC